MRLLIHMHAFRVPIVLHCCLDKVLVDCAEDGAKGVETGVEEHFVGLHFESV